MSYNQVAVKRPFTASPNMRRNKTRLKPIVQLGRMYGQCAPGDVTEDCLRLYVKLCLWP